MATHIDQSDRRVGLQREREYLCVCHHIKVFERRMTRQYNAEFVATSDKPCCANWFSVGYYWVLRVPIAVYISVDVNKLDADVTRIRSLHTRHDYAMRRLDPFEHE